MKVSMRPMSGVVAELGGAALACLGKRQIGVEEDAVGALDGADARGVESRGAGARSRSGRGGARDLPTRCRTAVRRG